ncbi:hypothetical protein ACGC1H_002627 [Rhizoctonia solani]
MLSHLTLTFFCLDTVWATEMYNLQDILSPPDDKNNGESTRNVIIGAIIGGMSLIALAYLVIFLYLRRHGRTFDDILLQRNGRTVENSRHPHGLEENQATGISRATNNESSRSQAPHTYPPTGP